MSTVNFNGKTITDTVIKEVLDNMAKYFGAPLDVTSGDRNYVPPGGSASSLHLSGRAADFKISGQTLEVIYLNLRNISANTVFVPGHSYEFIWHGEHTATGGPHLHIGRYGKNENGYVNFIMEGITPEGKNKYPVDLKVNLVGQLSGLLQWL